MGVNNELPVNELELNFFKTDKLKNFSANPSKLSEWLSLVFLSMYVYLEKALTYTPSESCDVGSCCLCPYVNSQNS